MKTVTRWEDMSKLMQQEDDALEAFYEEREAAEYRALEARIAAEDAALQCDGSGIIDEYYIDVDQTQVVKCAGCPACELAPAMVREASDEAPMPMWMGEETPPRRPMLPELDPTFKFISLPERMAS